MLQYLKDVKTFITVGVLYQGKNNIVSALLLCMKILKKLYFLQTIIDNSGQNHYVWFFFPKSKQVSFFCFCHSFFLPVCFVLLTWVASKALILHSPMYVTKKSTVEINKVIQFGKCLWKLSHANPLTPRTTSKLDQAVQGLVWLSPWKEMTRHLWASCASAGPPSPWKILPIKTGWHCPCCVLPLLALFLLLCISRRLWLCLCYSLPLGDWSQQLDVLLPGLLFLRLSRAGLSFLVHHPPAPLSPPPFWPERLQDLNNRSKRTLLVLQTSVKISFTSISYYSAAFSSKQVYNLQFSLSICKPQRILPSSVAG